MIFDKHDEKNVWLVWDDSHHAFLGELRFHDGINAWAFVNAETVLTADDMKALRKVLLVAERATPLNPADYVMEDEEGTRG